MGSLRGGTTASHFLRRQTCDRYGAGGSESLFNADAKNRKFFYPTGGRDNHKITDLMTQQRTPHWRLVRNTPGAGIGLESTNKRITVFASLGSLKMNDGPEGNHVSLDAVDHLGFSKQLLQLPDLPLKVGLLVLCIFIGSIIDHIARFLSVVKILGHLCSFDRTQELELTDCFVPSFICEEFALCLH